MTSLECGGGDRILSREAFEPASWEMQVWRKGIFFGAGSDSCSYYSAKASDCVLVTQAGQSSMVTGVLRELIGCRGCLEEEKEGGVERVGLQWCNACFCLAAGVSFPS